MDVVKIFCVLCLVLICRGLESSGHYKLSQETCKRIARDWYFDVDMVVGKTWRKYHIWTDTGFKYAENDCMDMMFTKPTQKTVERIRMEMSDYMKEEPDWEAAVLYMTLTVQSKTHEGLLFVDQGAAGSFLVVPNLTHGPNSNLARNSVPLARLQLKLVQHGKYLLAMDCDHGSALLAASPDDRPYRAEMASEAAAIARILNMGDGFPVCVKETHKDEHFQV